MVNFANLKVRLAKRKFFNSESDSGSATNYIGIIVDSEEDEIVGAFMRLKEESDFDCKKFRFMICPEEGVKNDIFEAPSFTRKNISWNGKITNPEVTAFLEQPYELIISFADAQNKMAAFLVSQARATLKVGREQNQENSFDFVIKTQRGELQKFLEEFRRYKRKIKTAV